MQLPGLNIDIFLRDFWQQKPLLIRNPWKRWINPIEPDELAGLACEEGLEARLIRTTPEGWDVEHGPFPETRFGELCREAWTLLVQAVDHQVPAVATLIEPFRFIPDWRIDDVMVSYAANGGGVGPHFDQYDVFLVQGLGRRRWQLGAACDATTAMLPHDDLRLLAQFEAVEEWILEPGDILYVPPRIAHNGTAVGDDCMTYSIGFRAPSRRELIADWCDHVLADLPDDDRYTDPPLQAQDNPGEISVAALHRLQALATAKLLDREAFARWFGRANSARKYPEIDWEPEQPIGPQQLYEHVAAELPLTRNPASRFSFVRPATGPLLLFVDGQCFECTCGTAALAEQLCSGERLTIDPALLATSAAMELLVKLCNQGSVAFDDED